MEEVGRRAEENFTLFSCSFVIRRYRTSSIDGNGVDGQVTQPLLYNKKYKPILKLQPFFLSV